MRKTMLVLAAAGALALGGCASDGEETTALPSGTDTAVTVADAWIPQPASDVSAMFGTITNSGTEAVTLTTGSVEGVGMVQVHEFVTEDNKQIMQEMPNGLEIPAGGSVELKPGSYHVMMMDVTADWKVGDEVPVTLEFTNNETVEVTAVVKAREGMNPDEATMDEGSMDMEASPSS
jgi:copper(I)-binding protein